MNFEYNLNIDKAKIKTNAVIMAKTKWKMFKYEDINNKTRTYYDKMKRKQLQ